MTPVTNTKRRLLPVVGLTALLCAGYQAPDCAAQPGSIGNPGTMDAVPELPFSPDELAPEGSGTRSTPHSVLLAPESIPAGEALGHAGPVLDLTAQPYCEPDITHDAKGYDLWDYFPAVTESSGTWLERGFWYAEADALVLNKFWKRQGIFYATDQGVAPPPFNANNRLLFLRGAHPGEDGSVRFTLGRFLFRDCENRDHTAEFTAMSGGDWVQQAVAEGLGGGQSLQVPLAIDGGNPTFDNSRFMAINSTSRFNSFEANYRVKTRMMKDQMVLQPSGEWVRRASPSLTKEFLVGLRYFDLTERFDWTAEDIATPAGNEDGQYLIRTDNNMIGMQLGSGHSYDTARWSVGFLGKAGVYLNDAKGRQRFIITSNNNDNSGVNFNNRMTEDQMSFIGEFRVTGRWHLRPNFSLRAGYEMMYVTSVALAANQVHFIPTFVQLGTSGDPFYHGASFGVEGYW